MKTWADTPQVTVAGILAFGSLHNTHRAGNRSGFEIVYAAIRECGLDALGARWC